MSQDRRADQKDEMRQLLKEVIRDERSLRRNGQTLSEYLGKLFTPTNVLLAGMFSLSLYSRFEKVETDVAVFRERTQAMEQQHERINAQLSTLSQVDQDRAKDLQEMANIITAQTEMLAGQTRELRTLAARQNATATRSEMNASIEQRVLPRLDRMEKALGTK